MKAIIYTTLSLCMLLAACNQKKSTDSVEMAEEENEDKFSNNEDELDAAFAATAADGGMLEVKLGEVAVKNASSPQIKQFAQQMIDEHSRGNAQLKALAEQKGISIPTVLSDKNQKKLDELSTKKGEEFDKAYAELMVKDHKSDVAEFRKESEKGKNPELKNWAEETLPTLEHHLQMAESNLAALQ